MFFFHISYETLITLQMFVSYIRIAWNWSACTGWLLRAAWITLALKSQWGFSVLWVDRDGLKRQMALWIIMRANRLAVYLQCQMLGTEQKLSVVPCTSKGKFSLVRHSSIPVCCQSLLWCGALERNLIIREHTFTMNQYRRTGQNLCLFLSQSQWFRYIIGYHFYFVVNPAAN